jgi:biopolymer transport protein ExbD
MNLSRKQRRELRTNKLRSREAELNIVSMIDVFAVLVFFLLVNSSIVSSRLNVISMNLPEDNADVPPPKEPPLALTVIVRSTGLALSLRNEIKHTLPNTPAGYDLQSLSNFLVEVKRNHPKENNITLSLEPEIAYDDLVRIMDAARLAPAEARAQGLAREMFPNIGLGDAVVETPAGAGP